MAIAVFISPAVRCLLRWRNKDIKYEKSKYSLAVFALFLLRELSVERGGGEAEL